MFILSQVFSQHRSKEAFLIALCVAFGSSSLAQDDDPDDPFEENREAVESAFGELRGATLTLGLPKLIYGIDNRRDVYAETDPELLHLAQAVCVVVNTGEIQDNGDGTYTLDTSTWTTQDGYPLCEDEPFKGQSQIGFCSGFLVGQDIVATAGHCIFGANCGSIAFIFNFEQIDETTPPPVLVSEDEVYFCNGTIDHQLSGDLDYWVIQLDRPVVGRSPVPIRYTGSVAIGDPLVVVGHPKVLPKKIADGAFVQNVNGSIPWFQANLDTYGGNSGSLVANLNNYTIEGILVRGAVDFVLDGTCTRSNVCPDTGCPGYPQFEEITKSTAFATFIPPLPTPTNTPTETQTTTPSPTETGTPTPTLPLTTVDLHSSPQPDLTLPDWIVTEASRVTVLKFRVTDHGLDGLPMLIDRIVIEVTGTAGQAGNDIAWAEIVRDASGRLQTAASISDTQIVFGSTPNSNGLADLDSVPDNASAEFTVSLYLSTSLLGDHDQTYVFSIDETGIGVDSTSSSQMAENTGAVTPVIGTLFITALGISITPTVWNLGLLPLDAAISSGSFTLQNTGNVSEDFSIRGTNGSSGWTLQNTTGENAFTIDVDEKYDGIFEYALSNSEKACATAVVVSGAELIGMKYHSPGSDTLGAGFPQDVTVTIKASRHVP